jgi:hypothetical protein
VGLKTAAAGLTELMIAASKRVQAMGSNNYGKTQYLTSSLIPASQTLKTND